MGINARYRRGRSDHITLPKKLIAAFTYKYFHHTPDPRSLNVNPLRTLPLQTGSPRTVAGTLYIAHPHSMPLPCPFHSPLYIILPIFHHSPTRLGYIPHVLPRSSSQTPLPRELFLATTFPIKLIKIIPQNTICISLSYLSVTYLASPLSLSHEILFRHTLHLPTTRTIL